MLLFALSRPRLFDARWALEAEDTVGAESTSPGLATVISLPSTRRVS